MKRFSVGYFAKEGVWSIFSHGLMSFAAVCMIVCCLLIMGSFTLVAVNVDNMLGDYESQHEFLAYIDESYTQEQAMAIQSRIESVANVESVTFVTKEEAMEIFVADYGNDEIYASLPSSVLRDRYRITVVDLESIQTTVNQVSQVTGVADTSANYEIAEGFVVLRNIATMVAVILVIVLLLISLFIISNTIKLAAFTRRDEIAIMKMCGATNGFVRWPFVFEGLILGIVGAIVAFIIQWVLYTVVGDAIAASDSLQLLNILPFGNMGLTVLGIFAGTGIVIGVGGSVLAIGKFLQV